MNPEGATETTEKPEIKHKVACNTDVNEKEKEPHKKCITLRKKRLHYDENNEDE